MPPGKVVVLDAAQLRKKSLTELVSLAQELGLNLAGLEDRASSIYTRLMQYASEVDAGVIEA